MLPIFVILLFIPQIFAFDPYSEYSQINLPPGGPIGPESIALDRNGEGPYISVSDGRILKYQNSTARFEDFAYTAPNRDKQFCDGVSDINLGPKCGRVISFSFDPITGDLYLVDTFFGLFVVGPNGGKAKFIANSARGVPFNYLNAVDVNPNPLIREVILTEASQVVNIRDVTQGRFTPDSSGRLMKYNLFTKEIEVLLDGLPFLGGVSYGHDGLFVLYSELANKRIIAYNCFLGRQGVLLNLPAGSPVKIKRAPNPGEFWVAANDIVQQPRSTTPFGYKFNFLGQVLVTKNLQSQYSNTRIVLLQEYNVDGGRTLYVGSRFVPYVGVFNKP